MQASDILIIITIVVAIALFVMYKIGRKNYAKNLEAQSFIEQYKTVTPILVIDKKLERPNENNVPKAVYDQLPKMARLRKMPMVKAKVGPQIMTLFCDKSIYDALIAKKTTKVELAGIYITKINGLNLEDKKKKTIGERVSLFLSKNSKGMK